MGPKLPSGMKSNSKDIKDYAEKGMQKAESKPYVNTQRLNTRSSMSNQEDKSKVSQMGASENSGATERINAAIANDYVECVIDTYAKEN